MTELDRKQQEKDVLYEEHRIRTDLEAHLVKAERIANSLNKLSTALREHPEAITGTPSLADIAEGRDYREALAVLDRQALVAHCQRITALRQELRAVRITKARLGLGESAEERQ